MNSTPHLAALLLLLALFASLFVASGHEGHNHGDIPDPAEPENSDVVVLTDDNFDSTIEANDYVFAEFYAPWCGHCKRLAPAYEDVATHFKGTNVIIAKIDCTQSADVASKQGIRGYPTLKFFKNGKPTDYDGGRTAEDIIRYISKKTSPASTELPSQADLDAFLGQAGTKIVAFLSVGSVPAFVAAAGSDGLDDFLFAHVTDSSLFGDKAVDSVVLYKADSESPLVYSGEIDKDRVVEWVLSEGFPLVEELAQKIWQRSSAAAVPLLAVFVADTSDENLEFAKALATPNKGKILSSYSTAAPIAERWGASGKVLPTAVLVSWNGPEPKLIVFDEEAGPLTVESGLAFVEQALSGTYQSYKKSEPVPESNDGPVTVIVGKNFQQIVNDPEKDVFVKFYAPWCGHCKTLAPIWDELGAAFSHLPSVVIGKIDATANSYPDNIEIRGFPTLLFFSADSKEPVPYNGDRDLESLKEFVSQHASRSVEKEDL